MSDGPVMWTPAPDAREHTRVGEFMAWVEQRHGRQLADHQDLWRWSTTEVEQFWQAVWDFFGVRSHSPAAEVLVDDGMPRVSWFPGATLNYAEHALGGPGDRARTAVLGRSQTRADVDLTFGDLADQVARARAALAALGVGRGDRVAGYLPNIPEALVAFLACAGLGAVWTSCAIEFGAQGVVDRFGQVEPVVLVVAGGYTYGATPVSRVDEVAEVAAGLPSVRHVVDVRYGTWRVDDALSWPDLLAAQTGAFPEVERVPFDHPLVILFSSGTTGRPKAIVHGHGGVLLEHLKNHALSWDMGPADRMLWFTTTSWMMWNALVSSLLVGSSIVMVDGNPGYPGLDAQWRLAEQTGATVMGASPGYVMACRAAGVDVRGLDLRVRVLGSAGSPLPESGYAWLVDQLGPDVQLNVGSGGTDVCSGIVQDNPLTPVRAGRIAGPCLGVAAAAFDPQGREVVGELGELVITRPMPSMPVGLWGDDTGERLRSTYFETYPQQWRHGDWVVFHDDGSCTVAGRSDATLNRGGVRLGTSEFYQVVEDHPEVSDSLVVHLEDPEGGAGLLVLFLVPAAGADAEALEADLRGLLRRRLSPRHVPDRVVVVGAVPRNRTGKKLEVPVKRILLGRAVDDVVSRESLTDPDVLEEYARLAAQMQVVTR